MGTAGDGAESKACPPPLPVIWRQALQHEHPNEKSDIAVLAVARILQPSVIN